MIKTFVNAPIAHPELNVGWGVYGLAHEALKSKEYRERLVTQAKSDRVLILDNGADELGEGLQGEEFWDLVEEVRPDVVIAPDVLKDGPETIHRTTRFLYELSSREALVDFGDMKVMGVAQGKTLDEWINSYLSLISNSRIHIVGVPYDVDFSVVKGDEYALRGKKSSRERSENRVDLMAYLQNRGLLLKTVHFLGLNDLGEFLHHRTQAYDVEVWNDTTAPFAAAVDGRHWEVDKSGEKDWPSLDFQVELDPAQYGFSINNLLCYFLATGDREALARLTKLSEDHSQVAYAIGLED